MLKSPRPAVRVRVFDPRERPITSAVISASTHGGNPIPLTYDPEWRVYASPLLKSGGYTL